MSERIPYHRHRLRSDEVRKQMSGCAASEKLHNGQLKLRNPWKLFCKWLGDIELPVCAKFKVWTWTFIYLYTRKIHNKLFKISLKILRRAAPTVAGNQPATPDAQSNIFCPDFVTNLCFHLIFWIKIKNTSDSTINGCKIHRSPTNNVLLFKQFNLLFPKMSKTTRIRSKLVPW